MLRYVPVGNKIRDAIDRVQREMIVEALDRHQGNVTWTASELGIQRGDLFLRMKRLGISNERPQGEGSEEEGSGGGEPAPSATRPPGDAAASGGDPPGLPEGEKGRHPGRDPVD